MEWRKFPIKEAEHLFEISEYGDIKKVSRKSIAARCPYTKERLMKAQPQWKKGYMRLKCRIDKKKRQFFIHRLVALAFIEKVEGKPHVNHLDGNKKNNHYSNLEWCTPQENNEHGVRIGLLKRGKKPPKPYIKRGYANCVRYKPVIDLNTGIFWTTNEVAAQMDVTIKFIHRMLSEERKPNTSQYRYA